MLIHIRFPHFPEAIGSETRNGITTANLRISSGKTHNSHVTVPGFGGSCRNAFIRGYSLVLPYRGSSPPPAIAVVDAHRATPAFADMK